MLNRRESTPAKPGCGERRTKKSIVYYVSAT
jgi:hypothetical protein